MSRSPQRCPFCQSFDLRTITSASMDLTGYGCHDCERVFYVTPPVLEQPQPEEPKSSTVRERLKRYLP